MKHLNKRAACGVWCLAFLLPGLCLADTTTLITGDAATTRIRYSTGYPGLDALMNAENPGHTEGVKRFCSDNGKDCDEYEWERDVGFRITHVSPRLVSAVGMLSERGAGGPPYHHHIIRIIWDKKEKKHSAKTPRSGMFLSRRLTGFPCGSIMPVLPGRAMCSMNCQPWNPAAS
ncbi:MAG: hypothetical protein GX776_10655 [Oxalobacter sp.]|nr:hypothetical protein [Oxalobacter sp.]